MCIHGSFFYVYSIIFFWAWKLLLKYAMVYNIDKHQRRTGGGVSVFGQDLLMATEDYRYKLAVGIANGIDAYLEN